MNRPPRSPIFQGMAQVGYVEWNMKFGTKGAAFDMKGNRLYDVDEQLNLIEPRTANVLGRLAHAGASFPDEVTAASELFPPSDQ